MMSVKSFKIHKIEFHIDKIVIFFIITLMCINMLHVKMWQKRELLYWDVVSYYAYLPATFIYKDLSLKFIENYSGEHEFVFWPSTAPNGNYVIKTSMGLSYLYAPWFFIGHLIAINTNYDAGGFSEPYKICLQFGTLIYFLIGLLFLRKVLLRYFNKYITALVILAIVVGTNLYYYVVYESTMSHSYSFVLFSIFLWATMRWHDDRNWKFTVLIGLLSGLITLIRPTNIIVLIIFALWGVTSFKGLKERAMLFLREYPKVIIMMLCFIAVWIPQFIYWYQQTGHIFYYSYGEEGFFFTKPKFFKSLFSYRKGWLVYSPIMILSLIGLPLMTKYKEKEGLMAIVIFTFINMWIIFSWWCWWWGGSFGYRALIDSYAFLAIPMGTFMKYIYEKRNKLLKISFSLILTLMISYSVFMTVKYRNKSIHYDSMTKQAFWYNFFEVKTKPGYWEMLDPPDYDKALHGQDE